MYVPGMYRILERHRAVTPRISCWLSADCTAVNLIICQNVTSTRKNQSDSIVKADK